MSRKKLFIFIITLLVAFIFLFALFTWLGSKDDSPDSGEGTNFFSKFNPFANPRPSPDDAGGEPSNEEPDLPGEIAPEVRLRRVSSMPVAGFAVFEKERYKNETPVESSTLTPPATEYAPALRYVARSSGNIYQTFADEIDERKFSSTLIPKVHEAYFGNRGESVIMRYLKGDGRTITTFVAPLPKEPLGGDLGGNYEIRGTFLPENISDLTVSPDTSKIFYLLPVGEKVVGLTASALGDKKSQIFESAFTEWLPSWPKSNMITLTTKPSFNTMGYVYTVNTDRKELGRSLGEINGLTALASPDGKKILYSNNTLSLNVYDTATREAISFGVQTLPEKCVWGRASEVIYCSVPQSVSGINYPDAWYKGEVSFSDEIWMLDTVSENAELVSSLVSYAGPEDMDNIKLALDDKEEFLFFVNKKDSFLWELLLK